MLEVSINYLLGPPLDLSKAQLPPTSASCLKKMPLLMPHYKVSSGVPLQWRKHDKVPFKMPFQWRKCIKVPSRVSFKLVKHDKVPSRIPFLWRKHDKVSLGCTLLPRCLQLLPFNFFPPLPLKHLRPPTKNKHYSDFNHSSCAVQFKKNLKKLIYVKLCSFFRM